MKNFENLTYKNTFKNSGYQKRVKITLAGMEIILMLLIWSCDNKNSEDSETATASDADTDADADADTDADSDADTDTDTDADTDADSDTDTDTDTDADSDADTDSDTDTDTDTGTAFEIDAGIDGGFTDTETETDAEDTDTSVSPTDTDSETDTETDTGTDTSIKTHVFINEIHYDNEGVDYDEGIEIAGSAGTSLENWKIIAYNGNDSKPYKTTELTGTIPNEKDGFGALFFTISGLQNGMDGFALVNADDEPIQFLSCEGSFSAISGSAEGLTSLDIEVLEESDTPAGFSLQLTGNGTAYEDFTWQQPSQNSRGLLNEDQDFIY